MLASICTRRSPIPGDHELEVADLHPEPNAVGLAIGHFVGEVSQEAGGGAKRRVPYVDLARLQEGQVERVASHRHTGAREIAVPEHLGFKEADRVTHRIDAPEENDTPLAPGAPAGDSDRASSRAVSDPPAP
jgi:hypothetical protein